jgi:hypothetical protein
LYATSTIAEVVSETSIKHHEKKVRFEIRPLMASPTWMPSSTLHVHRSQFQIPTNAILLRVLEPNDPAWYPAKGEQLSPKNPPNLQI